MMATSEKFWREGVEVEIQFYWKAPDTYEVITTYTTRYRIPLKLLKTIDKYYNESDIKSDIFRIVAKRPLNNVNTEIHVNLLPYQYVRQENGKYLVRPLKCGIIELKHQTTVPSKLYIQFAKMKQDDVIKYLKSLEDGI